MTIEFHCPHCGKLLKTAADKAGAEAKCPGCGGMLSIPSAADGGDDPKPASDARPRASSAGSVPPGRAAHPLEQLTQFEQAAHGDQQPAQFESRGDRPCPVCGQDISTSSEHCPFCGEALLVESEVESDDVPPTARRFVTSDILSRSWTIFQQRYGVLMGASLLFWLIQSGIAVVGYGAVVVVALLSDRLDFDSWGALLVSLGVGIPALALWLTLTCFLQGGYRRMLLDSAQGKPVQFGQLFSGGRFLWRLLAANTLFAALVGAGSLLLLAPGVYAAVALWPFVFVLIDQDCGVVEAFERSWKLTEGNRLAGFVLCLALGGIAFGVVMIPCFGPVFGPIIGEPFAWLCLAVAYGDMTGRLSAERNPPESSSRKPG